MIFSKDKKPTDPGLYWARLLWKDEGDEVHPVTVKKIWTGELIGSIGGRAYEIKSIDKDVEWGDRIEIPTVEAAMSGKGEA